MFLWSYRYNTDLISNNADLIAPSLPVSIVPICRYYVKEIVITIIFSDEILLDY